MMQLLIDFGGDVNLFNQGLSFRRDYHFQCGNPLSVAAIGGDIDKMGLLLRAQWG